MLVEAKVGDDDWTSVEFHHHGDHVSQAYGQGKSTVVMSTKMDEQSYLEMLDKKGIKYEAALAEIDNEQ